MPWPLNTMGRIYGSMMRFHQMDHNFISAAFDLIFRWLIDPVLCHPPSLSEIK